MFSSSFFSCLAQSFPFSEFSAAFVQWDVLLQHCCLFFFFFLFFFGVAESFVDAVFLLPKWGLFVFSANWQCLRCFCFFFGCLGLFAPFLPLLIRYHCCPSSCVAVVTFVVFFRFLCTAVVMDDDYNSPASSSSSSSLCWGCGWWLWIGHER